MTTLVGLAVGIPLVAAMLALLLRNAARWRDVVTLGSLVGLTGIATALLVHVRAEGTVVLRVGGWDPELGIVLVAGG